MNFLKENRKYITSELHGNISNYVRFQLKDLFRVNKEEECEFCEQCECLLGFSKCVFCGKQQQEIQIKETGLRNYSFQKSMKKQKKTQESLILLVDLSGSMECSYPTKYKKINKEFVTRSIGEKSFAALKSVIGEEEVIKNYKGIQLLLDSGQTVRDVAFTFKQQLQRERMYKQSSSDKSAEKSEEQQEYMTRKEIIEIGVSKYLEEMRKERPNTLVTLVYFNSNVEIPTDNFLDKVTIPGLEDKSVEQIVELGEYYADKISIQPVSEVGSKLVENLSKAEANGQTALSPALAFSLGLAKKFKHDLHQIVVVTDGMSNVGFAQTEDENDLQKSKKIYEELALSYAVPNACVVNVIGFEDCPIGYDILDQLISKTGGLPYNISFTEENKEKWITNETIESLKFEMITGFLESTKQFCYETKVGIRVTNKKLKLRVADSQLNKFITYDSGHGLGLSMGIKSVNDRIEVMFSVEEESFSDEFIKFSVIAQYKRKARQYFVLREELISVRAGNEEDAVKDQSQTLEKQIIGKLKLTQFEQENFSEYQSLEEKINQNAQICSNIDPKLLEDFKKKKQLINEYEKTTDKLTKDKRTMMSRRHETYKRREASSDEEEDDDGFL